MSGFESGFNLGLSSFPPPRPPRRNSRRVERNLEKTQQLVDEVKKGHILGPFDSPPLNNMVFSPLNIAPKPGTDKWRLIHDLSFPRAATAINQCIPKENAQVQYHTINDVIQMALEISCDAHGTRIDINSAFCNLPIRFQDLRFLGFTLKGKYYINSSLPFGASSSCQLFEKVACILEWVVKDQTQCKFFRRFPNTRKISRCTNGSNESFYSSCRTHRHAHSTPQNLGANTDTRVSRHATRFKKPNTGHTGCKAQQGSQSNSSTTSRSQKSKTTLKTLCSVNSRPTQLHLPGTTCWPSLFGRALQTDTFRPVQQSRPPQKDNGRHRQGSRDV